MSKNFLISLLENVVVQDARFMVILQYSQNRFQIDFALDFNYYTRNRINL